MKEEPVLRIDPVVSALETEMVGHRRHLHQNPELAFEEHDTALYITERLKDLDVEVTHPVAETGVVALMKNGGGPCVALRADMDALPIVESEGLDFRSQRAGVMHACGHDGHVAILLGVAKALDSLRDEWRGTLKFLFQPAEEGKGGAPIMIREGVLQDPAVDAIFGLHIWNYQPFGTVGLRAGPVMAAADTFTITVEGKGGHCATPHVTVDPIVIASHIVVALQSIVGRNVDPLDSAVVTVGRIEGGEASNVIPDRVTMQGSVRAYRESVRLAIRERLHALCEGVAGAHGARAQINYDDGYPPTVNDDELTRTVARAARRVVSGGLCEPYLTMGAEDMAFYLQEVPGCFFFVGSAKPGNTPASVPHHCAHFDFDERALGVGASVFLEIVRDVMAP